MSTLAFELAAAIAPAIDREVKPSLWRRFVKARQAKADNIVHAHLAAMTDAGLAQLGLTQCEIDALRAGKLPLSMGGPVS